MSKKEIVLPIKCKTAHKIMDTGHWVVDKLLLVGFILAGLPWFISSIIIIFLNLVDENTAGWGIFLVFGLFFGAFVSCLQLIIVIDEFNERYRITCIKGD